MNNDTLYSQQPFLISKKAIRLSREVNKKAKDHLQKVPKKFDKTRKKNRK